MDKRYWIGRKRSAMSMARRASSAETRLIHYQLAGRYGARAAHAPAFMIPEKGPATAGEGVALTEPDPSRPGPAVRPDAPPHGPSRPGGEDPR